MSDLRRPEYEALRATIRERGTFRVCAVLVTFVAWGALATAISVTGGGAAAVIPLAVLAAGFEVNFFVHTGVERIGRYLQVLYEEKSGEAGWETAAMNYGARFPGAGSDPIFGPAFLLACGLDFIATLTVLRSGGALLTALSFVAHALVAYRIVRARRASASQRALDLERFRALVSK